MQTWRERRGRKRIEKRSGVVVMVMVVEVVVVFITIVELIELGLV